jgi:hypothetical protein
MNPRSPCVPPNWQPAPLVLRRYIRGMAANALRGPRPAPVRRCSSWALGEPSGSGRCCSARSADTPPQQSSDALAFGLDEAHSRGADRRDRRPLWHRPGCGVRVSVLPGGETGLTDDARPIDEEPHDHADGTVATGPCAWLSIAWATLATPCVPCLPCMAGFTSTTGENSQTDIAAGPVSRSVSMQMSGAIKAATAVSAGTAETNLTELRARVPRLRPCQNMPSSGARDRGSSM